MHTAMKPSILTPGDPAGIGPEISLRAWLAGRKNIVLQGDIGHLEMIADEAELPIRLEEYDGARAQKDLSKSCQVIHKKWAQPPVAGQPNPANAPQVIAAIEEAVKQVHAGQFSALVTNPIAKDNLYQAGFSYPGHTEFLAMLDGADKPPVMMLANPELKVVPLTIHIPLSQVERTITPVHLSETLTILGTSLRQFFGISQPHIAIAGLNPHAGESGYIGRFEIDMLKGFLSDFKPKNIRLSGPYSADSLFHAEARQSYDAVLCMYHDQALIPIKTIDFFKSVNITLGLSFIRTSPDHGTAFDRAARFNARPDSLIAAIDMAHEMAGHAAK